MSKRRRQGRGSISHVDFQLGSLIKTQLGASNCLVKLKLKPLSLYPCIEGDLVHKNGNVEGLSLFPDGNVRTNANLQKEWSTTDKFSVEGASRAEQRRISKTENRFCEAADDPGGTGFSNYLE